MNSPRSVLHRLDAGGGQHLVEVNLLGDHRFRFHHRADAVAPGDFEDDGAGLRGILGPVHLGAVFHEIAFELFDDNGRDD